jgi:glucose-6-phosphate isomerase
MSAKMNTTPPTECPAWEKLRKHAARARGPLSGAPIAGGGIALDASRQRIDAEGLQLLAQLAAERGFDEWRAALLAGEEINVTEKRKAWHTALRGNEVAEVKDVLTRMNFLCGKIRKENKFKTIINLGTGGSDLGPRLLADAFADKALDVRFVANIDPVELQRALQGATPESTLFVVVSKTFTTQETMANAAAAKQWGGKHFYAVTANTALAKQFGAAEVLPMWDWVGGRYSVWSAAGFAGLCAIGPQAFEEFLQGGHEMDVHFEKTPVEKNLPALLGLLGVWNVNFLGHDAHCVLPYAHRLRLLPLYLQQLEMESNGKSVDREGRALGYATAPALFGAEGTNSQHSFHQLLHQGTQAIPCDFIEAGAGALLAANARAQADALSVGTTDASLPPHRRHPGGRPSSFLSLEHADPRGLGRLIALYEHKVFTQGVIWNINSFDQWGVELGKTMANELMKGAK